MVCPHLVRGVVRAVLEHRHAQQMEYDEARYLVEIGVAREADLLEGGLGAFGDAEAIHGDAHAQFLLMLHQYLVIPGRAARRRSGIHFATRSKDEWIPGSRYA